MSPSLGPSGPAPLPLLRWLRYVSLPHALCAVGALGAPALAGCGGKPTAPAGSSLTAEDRVLLGDDQANNVRVDVGEALAREEGAVDPDRVVPFENPTVPAGLSQPRGAKSDQVTVAQGLTLYGKLDPGRSTLLFFHGWSPRGQAHNVPFAGTWQKRGFNVLVYRWHRDSFCSFPPRPSQARVYESVAPAAVEEFLPVAQVLDKSKELRIVGHSLGGQMALATANVLLSRGLLEGRPCRVELIDPWVGFDSAFPAGTRDLGEGIAPGARIVPTFVATMDRLRAAGCKVVTYSSAAGGVFVRAYARSSHFVEMQPFWRGLNMVAKHNDLRTAYFASLTEAPPRLQGGGEAPSARMATDALPAAPRRYVQVAGGRTIAFEDDVFR